MDKLNNYRKIVQNVILPYSNLHYANAPNVKNEAIFDEKNDRYLIMSVGWEADERQHSCVVHVDIINEKIWIQEDNLEDGIADELVENGIPKSEIVLGFHEPKIRKYTEFATI